MVAKQVGSYLQYSRPIMQPLRICSVWDSEYRWDLEVEEVAREVVGGGHDVQIVARNQKLQSTVESLPEGTMHRLEPWSWAPGALRSASSFPAFFKPRWYGTIL